MTNNMINVRELLEQGQTPEQIAALLSQNLNTAVAEFQAEQAKLAEEAKAAEEYECKKACARAVMDALKTYYAKNHPNMTINVDSISDDDVIELLDSIVELVISLGDLDKLFNAKVNTAIKKSEPDDWFKKEMNRFFKSIGM